MGVFYCQNCQISHSITDENGIAICPKCKCNSIITYDNGNIFNLLDGGRKVKCIHCEAEMALSVNEVLQRCPNNECVGICDKQLSYNYHIYSGNNDSYIRNNFTAFLDVAKSGFGTEMEESDVLEHLSSADVIIVCVKDSIIIAFATVIFLEDTLYLHGMVVDVSYQGCGIGKTMLHKITESEYMQGIQYLTLATQNPYMYSLVSSFCDVIFPNSFSVPCGNMASKINEIAIKLSIKLSLCHSGNFLIKKRYKRCLYQKLPGIEKSAVFKDNLRICHWRSRDALLLFGRLKQ